MKRFLMILLLSIALSISITHAIDLTLSNPDAKNRETVVLIHGLGRSNTAMWLMAKRLKDAGYHIERVGYDSFQNTPEEILQVVSEQINACCAQHDKPVHFVGHSLGGLLIRAYLGEHQIESLGKVVLIGSPNKGTPVVDLHKDKWWMKFAGDTALALGTDANGFPQQLPAPNYPLGIIAGVAEDTAMSEDIPGEDDGLVPVASTKVDGMDDFIILPTSHSMMRYDKAVFQQTLAFIQTGTFSH